MSVRAKFRCTEKTSRTTDGGYGAPKPVDSEEVKLTAVTGEGNEAWSKYTPSGVVTMALSNPEAFSQFQVGKDYYLDFTLVPTSDALDLQADKAG